MIEYVDDPEIDDLYLEVWVVNFQGRDRAASRAAARRELARQTRIAVSRGWRRWAGCFHADGDYYHMHLVRNKRATPL